MVHRALRLALVAALAALAACGAPAGPAEHAGAAAPSAREARASDYAEGAWGKFHSKRFQLTVPLPDGHAWRIDDHRSPELVAVHAATDSRLVVALSQEGELMNRERCEARVRSRGWVPDRPLSTVEDEVRVGPDAYDSRVWTAVAAPRSAGGEPVEGHVFLFGAYMRRCLLVHLSTRAPADAEAVLASRLATAASRIVRAIAIDASRTTDDATLPRARR